MATTTPMDESNKLYDIDSPLIVDLSEEELGNLIYDFLFLYVEAFHTTREHLQHKHGQKPEELHLLPYWILNLIQGQSRAKEMVLASNNTRQRLQLCILMLQNAILDKLYDRVRYTIGVLALVLFVLFYKFFFSTGGP